MNKKIFALLPALAAAFVMAFASFAMAAQTNALSSENPENGFDAILIDEADLLTPEQEQEVMQEMEKVTGYCTAVFLTSDKPYTGSVVKYARSRMEEVCASRNLNGYTSVIFLIDMYNRELTIYSGETVFSIINTGLANSITDNTYSFASKGDYKGAAKEAFSQIFRVLEGRRIAQPMRYICAALLAIFVGLAVALLLVRAKTRKLSIFSKEEADQLVISKFDPLVSSQLVSTKKVRHVEVTYSGGGGGGGFSGGGGGGGFSGGGGGGGFSGSGGGGSHKF